MIPLNCAALAPSLMESELFGHEPGAFTGASQRRTGRFETAHGGTLFLDEIGLIPMPVQEKILRVVEYGAFERVGGSQSVNVDVRILGATNADMPTLVDQARFKADLLDRLSFEVLRLPPLRERHGDVMLLTRHFAERMALELGLPQAPGFSEEAVIQMESHTWPGNVRQLKNTVERAVYRCEGEVIIRVEFDPFEAIATPLSRQENRSHSRETPASDQGAIIGKIPLPEQIRQLECEGLRQALEKARHHQGAAANLLGLTYHQFRALYRKHRDTV